MKLADFFSKKNKFKFFKEISKGKEPWSALLDINSIIGNFLEGTEDVFTDEFIEFCQPNVLSLSDDGAEECSITVNRALFVKGFIYFRSAGVYIGEGTRLEAGAIIKGPSVIGSNCDIRQGAYIRENVIVGDNCVVGHATEIKNSIIMNNTNAGHFNYVGDSILGSHVNLGAGAKLANLKFRMKDEIDNGEMGEIALKIDGKTINTRLKKFGAIIGDYTEIGCNAVTSPGTLIGANCWVYPNTTVPKGFYKRGVIIKNAGADSVQVVERSKAK
ncbi:Glucosamine-1-phosphate N-acetyltransferase [hydrothermal vent metagenome]|uniref:Glucosamine-1-phosphate N-acetyltransferase n=1 Tax=hydrothermal vent metagenome TaxID=652676 RepID=A0A3B1BME1_9ZZZZ